MRLRFLLDLTVEEFEEEERAIKVGSTEETRSANDCTGAFVV